MICSYWLFFFRQFQLIYNMCSCVRRRRVIAITAIRLFRNGKFIHSEYMLNVEEYISQLSCALSYYLISASYRFQWLLLQMIKATVCYALLRYYSLFIQWIPFETIWFVQSRCECISKWNYPNAFNIQQITKFFHFLCQRNVANWNSIDTFIH